MSKETITISLDRFKRLVKDSKQLHHLEANGVDNWEEYSRVGDDDDETEEDIYG